MQRTERPWIGRQRGARRSERGRQVASTCTIAGGENETRAIFLGHPCHDRVPVLRLSRDETFRMFGAIEHKIRAEVFRDVGSDVVRAIGHAVDNAVRWSRQRHRPPGRSHLFEPAIRRR